mgnify:CR=1 FL=1
MRGAKHTLGAVIAKARKDDSRNWTLQELAEKVKKKDGTSVTPQYLNDIEHDRRTPSEEVIAALARALDLDGDMLRLFAGQQPKEVKSYLEKNPVAAEVVAKAFRKALAAARQQRRGAL